MANYFRFAFSSRKEETVKAHGVVRRVEVDKLERAERRLRGLNLGADDYLTKPAQRAEVLAAIAARLERKKAETTEAESRRGFHPDFSSPEPLRVALGLTPREAEVLLWTAQGKTNIEIGTILGMSDLTVKQHLGHVFEKLGVEGRNPATLRALEVLSSPSDKK